MKYTVIYYDSRAKRWGSIFGSSQDINTAHDRMDQYRAANKGAGYPHWQVVEANIDLTTLPPPNKTP